MFSNVDLDELLEGATVEVGTASGDTLPVDGANGTAGQTEAK